MPHSRVTAEELYKQCRHGLIEDVPVPIADKQKTFRQLLKKNNTKTNEFRVIGETFSFQIIQNSIWSLLVVFEGIETLPKL